MPEIYFNRPVLHPYLFALPKVQLYFFGFFKCRIVNYSMYFCWCKFVSDCCFSPNIHPNKSFCQKYIHCKSVSCKNAMYPSKPPLIECFRFYRFFFKHVFILQYWFKHYPFNTSCASSITFVQFFIFILFFIFIIINIQCKDWKGRI